jgi:Na+/H+ antiporter NhaD/arsenite permease-like protein
LMGPPIVYSIAKTTGVNPEAIYLLLAFSITIGSVTTACPSMVIDCHWY